MYLSGDSFVSLAGHKAIVNNELDIAAFVIHDPLILAPLGPVLEVLPTATVDTSTAESFLQVTGFPQSKNKLKKWKCFNRHGVILSLDEVDGGMTKLSKEFHSEDVIYHTLSPKQLVDDNNKKTNFLSRFEGFSGGPVVKYSATSQSIVVQLAGIFTRWERKTGRAMSVQWEAVLDWMEYVTPEILNRKDGLTALTPRL